MGLSRLKRPSPTSSKMPLAHPFPLPICAPRRRRRVNLSGCAMSNKDQRRFERRLDLFQAKLPAFAARRVASLRRPSARLVRLPAGIFLIAGGVFGFLPVLGFWMLPLGLLLLAIDVPLLKRPTASALVRAQSWWRALRRRR
jgi:hypothetical protein